MAPYGLDRISLKTAPHCRVKKCARAGLRVGVARLHECRPQTHRKVFKEGLA